MVMMQTKGTFLCAFRKNASLYFVLLRTAAGEKVINTSGFASYILRLIWVLKHVYMFDAIFQVAFSFFYKPKRFVEFF